MLPDDAWYLPASQSLQVPEDVTYFPAVHSKQSELLSLPAGDLGLEEGQFEQELLPTTAW